jgi:SPP1 family predicted phage head-tail adaptor
LQTVAQGSDSYGGVTITATTLATVWAQVESVKGSEKLSGNQHFADIDEKFTIRYSSTVASLNCKNRISYNGATFDIIEVVKIPRHRPEKLVILANRRND